MNYKIREKCCNTFVCSILSLIAILPVASQTPVSPSPADTPTEIEQLYVVSAQAGGVSAITGTAQVERADKTSLLTIGDELVAKEKVSVETDGKIEVLLNPGSYLRVGGDSNFEFVSTGLSDLNINLARGSALIEATTVGGERGANISLGTPQTVIRFEKSGLYRVNVTSDATELYVWSGEARVGNELVKKGRKLIVGKTVAAIITKFDKDKIAPDALDSWSRTRADELAKLNQGLENLALRTSVASINYDNNFSTGYWCYNRVTQRWCYVPFEWVRCCRAYNNQHTNQVAVTQAGGGPVVTVANSTKNRDTDKVRSSSQSDNAAKTKSSKSDSSTKSSKSNSSSNTDYPPSNTDYAPSKSDSSPPSKSEPSKSEPSSPSPSKSESAPTKSEPTKSEPTKSDSSPPSKKDGF